jgi:hypothetical protein
MEGSLYFLRSSVTATYEDPLVDLVQSIYIPRAASELDSQTSSIHKGHSNHVQVVLQVRDLTRLLPDEVLTDEFSVGKLTNTPNHESIQEGAGFSGVWVGAVPNLVFGEIKEAAERDGVASARIPGYWINKKGLEDASGKPSWGHFRETTAECSISM